MGDGVEGAKAYFVPLGDDRYGATPHTNGPWNVGDQHLGPPSALLVRELERAAPAGDVTLARVTVEILGPVPVAELAVRSWVERPGRSVTLVGAELSANGRAVARAWGWWLARTDTTPVVVGAPEPLPAVDDAAPPAAWPEGWLTGYLKSMDWVAVRGDILAPGPAAVWARQRVALVDGEEPTARQRLFAVADSGNGASNQLDLRRWLFVNCELTVHLWREPVGEWIGLDAATVLGPEGVGTATSTLHDRSGPVGRGAQALLVRPR